MSGQHIQCHAVGARCHTVLLPLEVEVATLPLVVADADAVGHREREGVGLVPEGHKLQLVQERSPGRNIRLPGERETERERYTENTGLLVSIGTIQKWQLATTNTQALFLCSFFLRRIVYRPSFLTLGHWITTF